MTLVVSIYVRDWAKFERFEAHAVLIMARHGGRIERRIRLEPDASTPSEVHIVDFPNREAFASYRADPEFLGLQELRASAISDTIVWSGDDIDLLPGG